MLAKQIIGSQNNQTLDFCGSTAESSGGSPDAVTVTTTLIRSETGLSSMREANNIPTVAVVGGTLGGALGLILLAAILAAIYVRKRFLRHQCSGASNMADDTTSLARLVTGPGTTATGIAAAASPPRRAPGIQQALLLSRRYLTLFNRVCDTIDTV